ncbi:unnamed protein product [Symbiodinium natans]|uniref:Uncharacterized protein n=1 Tax=Symbiodinium natans TaxID=878477 RepID=A0A812I9H6_9DINO|nr:unnamed protein product [Symbiodinium natans]
MLRGGAKKLLRSLQPNGNYHLTKLGKSFFKNKWVDWVAHVPVIIRGIRRNGRNRGMPYERTKRLPVTDLNVTLPPQSEGLSDAQPARNLKASALAQLGNPEPNDIIWELSDESYYLDATREWTFSQQAMQVVDDRVVVETVLDQPLGALRDVSYQLFCGDEILQSAFKQRPDKLCVPRQLAELMRLPLQEAPMFYVDCQGRLLDKYEPTVKEQRAVAFTSWNGHAFFYKSARTVAKCEPIGERARHCASSATGTKQPGVLARHDTGVALQPAGLRAVRGIASTPPLVFKLNSHKPDHICHGIDVVRCRKNGLAHAKFPAPIFCPKDNVEQAREGHLADLTYVRLREDGRWAAFKQLPYVGQGWYAKPAVAYMLEKGLATWRDFVYSLDATAHVDQESVAQALQKMEAAWPEGEEHYAKLSVSALIGLWARNMNLIYTMRTSNHQFDGSGCQHRELFLDAAGGIHWDHIYVTQLLSNRSCRPVRARLRDGLGVRRRLQNPGCTRNRAVEVPEGRQDGLRRLPKKFQGLVDSLVRERHPDGSTPVYRCEEVKGLEGQYRIPRIEAEWMCNIDTWKVAEVVTALREEGYKVKIITKTHSSVQNFGTQAETADHWVRSTVRNGYCNIDWLVVEEITQLDTGLWNDIACVSMNRKVKFLLLGDFRQFPTVMDNFAGTPVQRELKHCQLLHDLTDGWHHELTENRRSDPSFHFLRWLRVDEPREQALPEAVRAARERFPRQGEPDVSLVISHAHRIRINARDNRRLAPPEAVTIEYTGTGPTTTNMPQTMRVWPALKLIGVGGRVTKGIYVHVADVGSEKIVLDGGVLHPRRPPETHPAVPRHITYASCQGLTLSPHFYVGSSRATSSELLSIARILQRLLVSVPEVDSGQIDLELDEAVPKEV